ncbi:hypothetical protein ACOSP7_026703 [Xanthoceras sorbifolium]
MKKHFEFLKKKHFEFLKKKVFFHLLLLSLSSSSLTRFNHFLAIYVSQIKTTTLPPVLLFNPLKSFQTEDRNPAPKLKKFSTGKQKMPDPKI